MAKVVRTIAIGAAISLAFLTQAHALNTRTWISGTGVDQAGCGPIPNPCRTLQYAHDNTSAGGEIDVKDSAGYGSVAISKAISIFADGVFAGVLAGAGLNAIAINAGASDAVVLRGLAIEGAGVAKNGILFTAGGDLTVADCLVQNFGGSNGTGILLNHASGTPRIAIGNTVISSNAYVGIWYHPSGSGGGSLAIDRSTVNTQPWGIAVNMSGSTGSVMAIISNAFVRGSISYGVYNEGGSAKVTMKLENSTLSGNSVGFQNQGIGYIGRTSVIGNGIGVSNNSTLYSYGNNEIDGNTSADVSGTITGKALR